jgi:hypothetical protein
MRLHALDTTKMRRRETCLKAHAVKGVPKAILSGVTNVEAGRYEGAAFAPLFIDDAIRTRREVHDLNGGR